MRLRRSPFPAARHWLRVGLRAAIACFFGIAVAHNATGQGDPNSANDYFAARGSDLLKSVELYHLGLCEQHFRERDWPRTMSECNFILRVFPNHPSALLTVAQVCQQWKSGLCLLDETFQRAMEINPKAPGTYVVLGIYLNRTKQYANAIQSFKTALEFDPDQINANYNLALTYLDTKQFELANQHAQRAYELGATVPGLRNRLKQAGYWKPLEPASASDGQNRPQGGVADIPSKSPTGGK